MAHNHLKIVQAGDNVTLTCISPKGQRNSVVWVKQKAGEKPLSIASSYQGLDVVFENGFDKHNRFFVAKDDSSFILSITNAKESDTATYYCVQFIYQFKLNEATDLIVKGKQIVHFIITVAHAVHCVWSNYHNNIVVYFLFRQRSEHAV